MDFIYLSWEFCRNSAAAYVNEFKPSCIWSKLLGKDEPTFFSYLSKKLSNDRFVKEYSTLEFIPEIFAKMIRNVAKNMLVDFEKTF